MNGYIAQRRGRFYAVIYERLDPVTGRERRRWHPAGTDRAAAEQLAGRLAVEEQGRADEVRALTFGAYLTGQWLPGTKLQLATSTYRGYERNVHRHVVPAIGRIGLRRLRPHHIEALYDHLLTPNLERRALAPKTVYEVHLVIRGALDEAVRRGLLTDLDFKKRRLSLNRGLVSIGYELHQTRGKTENARRSIDLDATTLSVLAGWKALQPAEVAAVGIDDEGWVFTDSDGQPIHPHALSQVFERIARRAGVPVIRLHDLRHTHGTLLITEGVPVKVLSERLGHANIAFTIETYQHVLPGMQADAARVYERLTAPAPPDVADTVERRGKTA